LGAVFLFVPLVPLVIRLDAGAAADAFGSRINPHRRIQLNKLVSLRNRYDA
jgi:hypothetical protein